MKFARTYNVRSSEITPEYTLKDYYIGMYFQECFAEYVSSKKLAAFDLIKLGLTWLTSDVRIDFLKPTPFWRETVDMSVWFRKTTPARIYIDFSASHNGEEIAKGSSVQLIADAQSHKPVKVSEFVEKMQPLEVSVFPNETFGKIPPLEKPKEAENYETSQIVRFDDVDFNRHLNNVKYVPRALEALPLEYRLSHRLVSYRIKFLKETLYNDTVVSTAAKAGDECRHILRRQSDGTPLAEMLSVWDAKS